MVLGGYLLGVIPNLLAILLVRIHVLQRHFGHIFVLGMASLTSMPCSNWLLIPIYGLVGIALSTSITITLIALCYGIRLPESIRPTGWRVGWASFASSVLTAIAVEGYAGPHNCGTDTCGWRRSVVF